MAKNDKFEVWNLKMPEGHEFEDMWFARKEDAEHERDCNSEDYPDGKLPDVRLSIETRDDVESIEFTSGVIYDSAEDAGFKLYKEAQDAER